MASKDLATLLPPRFRDKTLDSIVRNIFNPHLSADESISLFGYVGATANSQSSDIYLTESSLERQLNQLTMALVSQQGSETNIMTWPELLQHMATEGIDTTQIDQWLNVSTLNFVPHINLDMFSNYPHYVWVGNWVQQLPTANWASVGILSSDQLASIAVSNPQNVPDYYVIRKGPIVSGIQGPIYTDLPGWSPWSLGNLWLHQEDAAQFATAYPQLSTADLIQARRPILEYHRSLKLSLHAQNGVPTNTGPVVPQLKSSVNQPPLFDLYTVSGAHAGFISSTFFYKEDSSQPVDSELGRRLAKTEAGYVFGHTFVHPKRDEPLFVKLWNSANSTFSLSSVWRGISEMGVSNVAYDTTGALVNQDKFYNFANYYWPSSGTWPIYNLLGQPEYNVIEAGGTSDWSITNKWVHVSTLTQQQLLNFTSATKPIIEISKLLEPLLQDPTTNLPLTTKTSFNQVPRFDLRTESGQLPEVATPPWSDAFGQGAVLVRVTELIAQNAILADPFLLQNSLTYNGEIFVSSLCMGHYAQTGQTLTVFDRFGAGNGSITAIVDPDARAQIIQFKGLSATQFSAVSTVFGILPNLNFGVPYSVQGTTILVNNSTVPFDLTTDLKVTISSTVQGTGNLYVNVGTSLSPAYKTVPNVAGLFTIPTFDNRQLPANGLGAWKTPELLFNNLNNDTPSVFNEGDLFSHFVSIIGAQPNLIGNSAQSNNYRQLFPDFSKGGTIKSFNDRAALLLGLLSQKSASVIELLDFSSESYASALNQIREYVESAWLDDLYSGSIRGMTGPTDSLDPNAYVKLKAFMEAGSIYATSTMPIKALTLTASYLGLVDLVKPVITIDSSTNQSVIICHDGHSINLPQVDFSVYKRLVTKQIKRSDGTFVPGIIGTSFKPTVRPYAQQLWLDLAGEKLYIYDVVTDIGVLPSVAIIGQFGFNRVTGEMWVYNGSWISLGISQLEQQKPWRQLDLSATLQALTFAFESELYIGCPSLFDAKLADITPLLTPVFSASMQKEFESFATRNSIIDPYQCFYDPADPFTWNYSSIGSASWVNQYTTLYGTPRPDLYPWIATGQTELQLVTDLYVSGLASIGPMSWSTTFWTLPGVAAFMKAKYASAGRTTQLSIDLTTGNLIAPFAFGSIEQVLSTPPLNPNGRFSFGQNGPVEMMWTKTLDYRTASMKSFYRVDPLKFVTQNWGDAYTRVGDMDVIRQFSRQPRIGDVIVHGDTSTSSSLTTANVSTTLVSPPVYTKTFKIEIVQAISPPDMSVSYSLGARITTDTSVTTWLNSINVPISLEGYVTVLLTQPMKGLNVGDIIEIVVQDNGTITSTVQPSTIHKLSGIGQLYGLYHAYNTYDLALSTDRVLLSGWTQQLAYRFNRFVDTDTLKIGTNPTTPFLDSTYRVLIKETLDSMVKATGLQITLLRRGSTQRIGSIDVPAGSNLGGDWIYRVDFLNPNQQSVKWFVPDQPTGSFLVQKTSQSWITYSSGSESSVSGPFAVTGLQNLISFVKGYEAWLIAQGFVFDTDTITFQSPLEDFINLQFSGVNNGHTFAINPFARKFKFSSPAFVTAFNQVGTTRLIPSLFGATRLLDQYRVFRDGDETTVISDTPIFGASVGTSNFEHIVLFDGLVSFTTGQRINRVFFSGLKQAKPTGKPVYGGKYMINGQMRTNIEASVKGVNSLYDFSAPHHNQVFDHSASLLAFNDASWMAGQTDQTKFQFWQGMLPVKGTNQSVDAFTATTALRSIAVDDVWAYKVAEYGDARKAFRAELNMYRDELRGDRVNYLLVEGDEEVNLGFDSISYDSISYDPGPVVDLSTVVTVKSDDEVHWSTYADLGALNYIAANILGIVNLVPTSTSTIYKLPYFADIIEVVDLNSVTENVYETAIIDPINFQKLGSKIYREQGDYTGSGFASPKFTKLNASSIVFNDSTLLNKTLAIVCYGPPVQKYTPSSIYHNSIPVNNNVYWWDPVRGVNTPAVDQVDIRAIDDPATYNTSKLASAELDVTRVWSEANVGKIWWNTSNLGYLPYTDVRINPNPEDRLSQWGQIAQWASMDIFGWIKSDNPPATYSGDGEVAIRRYLSRTRSWQARPVVLVPSTGPLHRDNYELSLVNGFLVSVNGYHDLKWNERIASFPYTDITRTVPTRPTGLLVITNATTSMVGSLADFTTPVFGTSTVLAGFEVLSTGSTTYGQITFAFESDVVATTETTWYVRATCTATKVSQRLISPTVPALAGPIEMNFDELGLTIRANTLFNRATWPSLTLDSDIAQAFGSASHNIYVRKSAKVDTLISPLTLSITGTNGWIGWMPVDQVYTAEELIVEGAPFTIYTGDWATFNLIESYVQQELQFEVPGNISSFREVWTPWTKLSPTVNEYVVPMTSFTAFEQTLIYTRDQLNRMLVYVNGLIVSNPPVGTLPNGSLYLNLPNLTIGSTLRIVIPFIVPTSTLLNRNLTGDPKQLSENLEYTIDMPYTTIHTRNNVGRISSTSYYFWVKNQSDAMVGKRLSTRYVADNLQNPGVYVVPQVLKQYNQFDGRPNRYMMISIKGLNNRLPNGAVLRLIEDGSMRDNDNNMSLRPVHTEWKLLRKNSLVPIPRTLWDKLVDTLCGSTATGIPLPYISISTYDQRHDTNTQFGIQTGQVLAPRTQALNTVRQVLKNTSVTIFSTLTNSFVPQPIAGLDLTQVDSLLSSSVSIRALFANIWNTANPRNINELFFAVLDDTLTNTYELADIFKTSFIALDELRE